MAGSGDGSDVIVLMGFTWCWWCLIVLAMLRLAGAGDGSCRGGGIGSDNSLVVNMGVTTVVLHDDDNYADGDACSNE